MLLNQMFLFFVLPSTLSDYKNQGYVLSCPGLSWLPWFIRSLSWSNSSHSDAYRSPTPSFCFTFPNRGQLYLTTLRYQEDCGTLGIPIEMNGAFFSIIKSHIITWVIAGQIVVNLRKRYITRSSLSIRTELKFRLLAWLVYISETFIIKMGCFVRWFVLL